MLITYNFNFTSYSIWPETSNWAHRNYLRLLYNQSIFGSTEGVPAGDKRECGFKAPRPQNLKLHPSFILSMAVTRLHQIPVNYSSLLSQGSSVSWSIFTGAGSFIQNLNYYNSLNNQMVMTWLGVHFWYNHLILCVAPRTGSGSPYFKNPVNPRD